MEWVSAFDATMAEAGPPAVFLQDFEGLWRFESDITRDCWMREGGLPTRDAAFGLMRDRATGFTTLIYTTGRGLFASHPRVELTWHPDLAAARAALELLGRPPIGPRG